MASASSSARSKSKDSAKSFVGIARDIIDEERPFLEEIGKLGQGRNKP